MLRANKFVELNGIESSHAVVTHVSDRRAYLAHSWAWLPASLLFGLSCLAGCGAETGASSAEVDPSGGGPDTFGAEPDDSIEDIGSTSQPLTIKRITKNATLLGCPNNPLVAISGDVPLNSRCYVGANPSDGGMYCGSSLGTRETFVVYQIDYVDNNIQSRIALKSSINGAGNGPYVSATNGGGSSIYANRSGIGDWESFYPSWFYGLVALTTHNGHYVVRERGGFSVLNANRTAIGPWESFRVRCL